MTFPLKVSEIIQDMMIYAAATKQAHRLHNTKTGTGTRSLLLRRLGFQGEWQVWNGKKEKSISHKKIWTKAVWCFCYFWLQPMYNTLSYSLDFYSYVHFSITHMLHFRVLLRISCFYVYFVISYVGFLKKKKKNSIYFVYWWQPFIAVQIIYVRLVLIKRLLSGRMNHASLYFSNN